MKYFFFFLFILSSSLYGEKEPLYITYVHQLQQSYAKEVQKSGLQLLCLGGRLMNDVEKIGLGFIIEKYVNVEEARRLYVNYAEPFRQMVNADRKIRPYLHNYPATINELKFSLGFPCDHSQEVCSLNIVHVFHANGEVCYFAGNSKEIHHETYEEALKIVQDEQQRHQKAIDEILSKLSPVLLDSQKALTFISS